MDSPANKSPLSSTRLMSKKSNRNVARDLELSNTALSVADELIMFFAGFYLNHKTPGRAVIAKIILENPKFRKNFGKVDVIKDLTFKKV